MATTELSFAPMLEKLEDICKNYDAQWIKRKRKIDTFGVVNNMLSTVIGSFGGMRSSVSIGKEAFSAQALCQAKERMPISVLHGIYRDFSNVLLKANDGPQILAVDGSKVILGETMATKPEPFPKHGNSIVRPHALISCIYNCNNGVPEHADVFNHHDERKAVMHQLATGIAAKKGDILVFDRGYYSLELAQYLHSLDLNYVFRVRRNANKEIKTCITEDVELHRKFGAAVWKGIEGLPKTRLLRFRKNDSTYVLLTNLDGNVYNDDSIKAIYRRRWDVEEYFRVLKDPKYLNGKRFLAHSLKEMRKELVFRMLSGLCIQATLLQQGVSSKGSNTMIKTRTKKNGEIVREKSLLLLNIAYKPFSCKY